MSEQTIVCDTSESIEMFNLLSMKYALKLEIAGLKHSRGSVYALAKKRFGFKGNKQSVLTQLTALIESKMPKQVTA